MAKRKAAKKTKPANIPAWTCPKCGATHPITVTACCKPAAVEPHIPFPQKQPTRVRFPRPFEVPFQPGIIPVPPHRPMEEWPNVPPQRWTWPPDITCTVHPSAGPDYQNSGFREVKP